MFKHRLVRWCSLCAVASTFVLGCKTDGGSNAGTGGNVVCPPGTAACTPVAGGTGAGTGGGTGGGMTPLMMLGTGGAPNLVGAGGTGMVPMAGSGGVPCDVAKVVSDRCTGCHSASPKFSAPMPLMTLADFHAMARSNMAKHVFEVIPTRINPTGAVTRMPPTSLPALTAAENQTLSAWVTAGAIGSAMSCPITETNLVPSSDAGVATMGGSGGASIDPIEYNDPEMKCYKFLAHADGDKTMPYTKAPGEQYMNFTFAPPWQGTVYQRAIKLVIDPQSKVIHHWLLFKQSAPVTDGAVAPGSGTHPDGILLHGWAPGASPLYLDPDVGVALESTVGYELEIHYNNATGAPGNDMSGAEVCVTPKVPAHIAELSWIGTDSISGTSATGTCSPSSSETIHLIAAQPHMHLKGNHMKVVINHAGGMAETIHDEDFMFENQRYYILHSLMMPGDTMTTTCSYSSPATFGSSTSNEMCYFFTLHWPAGALTSPGIGTVLHGADSCIPN
jgi:hypothetical protein